MKSALTLVLFVAASAFAQNTAPAQARTACGPLTAQFEAQAAAGQPAAQLEPGKALVYIAEDFRKAPGEIGNPTLRIGMDGAWVGATRTTPISPSLSSQENTTFALVGSRAGSGSRNWLASPVSPPSPARCTTSASASPTPAPEATLPR